MPETERVFTDYDGFTVEFMPNSHRYAILRDDERTPVVSVTSALGVLSKGALLDWYGRMDSEAVLMLEREGALNGIEIPDAHQIMRGLGFGAKAARDAGAARGTAAHDALEVYCRTGGVPALDDYDESVRGYVQAVCGWLVDARPVPLVVEQIVGSPTYGFAGRFDLITEIDGVRTLVDLKTGRNAHNYPESHIQLRGYELCFPECGIDLPDRAMVLYAAEDGHHETADCRASTADFLAVLVCQQAVGAVKKALRAKAAA